MPESEVDEILKSIDEKDLEEDDCFFVFTLVLVERSKVKAQQKNKKRTWQQSRDLKEAMVRDRSFFDRRRHQAPNKKLVRAGKKRLPIDQLNKPEVKSKPGFFTSASGRGGNCFVFALNTYQWAETIDQLIAEVRDNPRGMSFFCIQSGMAVVDTAAGQPLMG